MFVFKSLLTMPSNILPLHLKQTFPPIIWIFTEGESDWIKSRLPCKIFSEFYETILTTLVHCASTQLNPAKSEQYTSLLKLELLAVRYRETYNRSIYIPYFETGRIARQSRRREKEDWHMVKSWSDPMNIVKSINLQYITPGCWDDGTSESSTKSLMLQVLFF